MTERQEAQLSVVLVGQVPPPFGGQTIMTQLVVDGRYTNARIFHVDSRFSQSLAEMGEKPLRKVIVLLRTIAKILKLRAITASDVLYYHPAGAVRTAVLRDLAILSVVRPFFSTVIFHLHSRGTAAASEALPRPLRWLSRRVLACPDLVIAPTQIVLREAAPLQPRACALVPNATQGGAVRKRTSINDDAPLEILFLNLISQAKGVDWLLEAFADLCGRGVPARLSLYGEFQSERYSLEVRERCRALGIQDRVEIHSPVHGEDKWAVYARAHVFCFPSIHPLEAFGLVLIEAASCGLPIVASDIPAVGEVLVDGLDAILVDPREPSRLVDALELVCRDPVLRASLGRAARRAFEDRYTVDSFYSAMDDQFGRVSRNQRR